MKFPEIAEDKNLIRLLVVTQDDKFFLPVHGVATGCGWETRMVRTVERGLHALDEFQASVAIYDWPGTEEDWRFDVDLLTARPDHPCVLLASDDPDRYRRERDPFCASFSEAGQPAVPEGGRGKKVGIGQKDSQESRQADSQSAAGCQPVDNLPH